MCVGLVYFGWKIIIHSDDIAHCYCPRATSPIILLRGFSSPPTLYPVDLTTFLMLVAQRRGLRRPENHSATPRIGKLKIATCHLVEKSLRRSTRFSKMHRKIWNFYHNLSSTLKILLIILRIFIYTGISLEKMHFTEILFFFIF